MTVTCACWLLMLSGAWAVDLANTDSESCGNAGEECLRDDHTDGMIGPASQKIAQPTGDRDDFKAAEANILVQAATIVNKKLLGSQMTCDGLDTKYSNCTPDQFKQTPECSPSADELAFYKENNCEKADEGQALVEEKVLEDEEVGSNSGWRHANKLVIGRYTYHLDANHPGHAHVTLTQPRPNPTPAPTSPPTQHPTPAGGMQLSEEDQIMNQMEHGQISKHQAMTEMINGVKHGDFSHQEAMAAMMDAVNKGLLSYAEVMEEMMNAIR